MPMRKGVWKTMTFNFSSSYDVAYLTDINKSILFQWDVDGDGDLDFVGKGDSLWWGDDLNDINAFYKSDGKDLQVCVVQNSNPTALATVKSVKNDWVVEWFEFDGDLNSFSKKWENRNSGSKNVKLLKGEGQKSQIWISTEGSTYVVTQNKIENLNSPQDNIPYTGTHHGDRYYLSTMGISFTENSKLENIVFKGSFDYVSLLDLENDGDAELILTDDQGKIHALDSRFIYKNGFPIDANAISPILGVDVLNDENPELVFQNADGSILSLNNEGIEIDRIITGDNLIGVGSYNGNQVIITETKIIQFKKSSITNGNEWNYTFSSPDYSRILKYDKSNSPHTYLIDLDLTYAYPNPSYGDIVTFRIQVGRAENININIFDLAGFPVESINTDFQPHYFPSTKYTLKELVEVSWDVSKIESGVYLARVIVSADGKSEEKIIKVGVIK